MNNSSDNPSNNLNNDHSKLAESKLILMYLINKMEVPISLAYIQEFTLSAEYMDYYTLSNYLVELTESKYIIRSIQPKKTSYVLSDSGKKTLSLFENFIDDDIKLNVDNYVTLNQSQIKKDLDVVADFVEKGDEYIVTCGAYENKVPLMQINLKVSTKQYAKEICKNWKDDASKHYLTFIKTLLGEQKI